MKKIWYFLLIKIWRAISTLTRSPASNVRNAHLCHGVCDLGSQRGAAAAAVQHTAKSMHVAAGEGGTSSVCSVYVRPRMFCTSEPEPIKLY